MQPSGSLYIARDDQRESLMHTLDEVCAVVPEIHLVTAAEAVARVPVLRSAYLTAAFHEPGAKELDVHAIHTGYLKGLKKRGGELLTDGEVAGLERRKGRWCLEIRAGALVADIVVNAAGAWGDTVAELAGVAPVGLVPTRRTAITFDGPPGVDVRRWPLVVDIDERFY